VPLRKGVEGAGALWTRVLMNRWSQSCFEEVPVAEEEGRGAEEQEARIREGEGAGEAERKNMRFQHKHFLWKPSFTDVFKSVKEAPPGNDGWAVENGYIRSVSPFSLTKS
jgi:hypothetical protein